MTAGVSEIRCCRCGKHMTKENDILFSALYFSPVDSLHYHSSGKNYICPRCNKAFEIWLKKSQNKLKKDGKYDYNLFESMEERHKEAIQRFR